MSWRFHLGNKWRNYRDRKKINKKLEKAKKDGAEIKKKKRMQKKMVLKRKQDEKDKIKEYKIMKIEPKDENGEE